MGICCIPVALIGVPHVVPNMSLLASVPRKDLDAQQRLHCCSLSCPLQTYQVLNRSLVSGFVDDAPLEYVSYGLFGSVGARPFPEPSQVEPL